MDHKKDKLTPVAVALELWSFVTRPRRVVVQRKACWEKPTSVWAVFGWCSATVIVVLGLYGIVFGSLLTNLSSLGGKTLPPEQQIEDEPQASRIELVRWGLTWRLGVGMQLPHGFKKPVTVPQTALFKFGFTEAVLRNVVPAKLSSGSFPLLAQVLYALLLVLCLYPVARLMGGKASLADSVRVAVLLFSFTALTIVVLVVGCTILTAHIAVLPHWLITVCWLLLVQLPALIVVIRGYFEAFSENFGISRKRLFASSIMAMPVSCVVAPIVFVPALYIVLRFQNTLDVFL